MSPHCSAFTTSLAVSVLVLAATGCGEQPGDELRATAAAAKVSAWQDALPPTATDVTMRESVVREGCMLMLGTGLLIPPLPPQGMVFVQRTPLEGAADWCSPGVIVVGTSAQGIYSADLLVAARPVFVVDYVQRDTVSGEARAHLVIAELGLRLGETIHETGLRARPTTMSNGNVYEGALALDDDGTLVVTGTKNGELYGEQGTGENYRATWTRFLSDPDPTPAPTSIELF